MCFYFLIVMSLELSKMEWERPFNMKIAWHEVRVVHKDPVTSQTPPSGCSALQGNRYRSSNHKLPQGLRQSLNAQKYVAKALWDLLLQGFEAKDKCLLLRAF